MEIQDLSLSEAGEADANVIPSQHRLARTPTGQTPTVLEPPANFRQIENVEARRQLKIGTTDRAMETPEDTRRAVKEVDQYLENLGRGAKRTALQSLRNELFDDISDVDEQDESRKRSKREQREDIRKGNYASPTKTGASLTETVTEIKALRKEIRTAVSRRDANSSKYQFKVEDREKVLLNIDKLTDILIDLVVRDDVKIVEMEGTELINQIAALRIEIKDQAEARGANEGLKKEMELMKTELGNIRQELKQIRLGSQPANKQVSHQTGQERNQESRRTAAKETRSTTEKSDKRVDRIRAKKGQRGYNTEEDTGASSVQENRNKNGDSDASSEDSEEFVVQKSRRKNYKTRSYADIAGSKRATGDRTGWKTPETEVRHEAVVELKGSTKAVDTVKAIRGALVGKIGEMGPLKGIHPIENGRMLMRFETEAQKTTAIGELAKRNEEFTVKDRGMNLPRFAVMGIYKGYSENEVKAMILQENRDIYNIFGQEFISGTKEITRRRCRDLEKETIVFEAKVDIFKYIVKMKKINFEMSRLFVQEDVLVPLCFKCHKYGHIQRFCTDDQVCHFCGGGHMGKDCRATEPDCPNCKTLGIERNKRKHSARDRDCPIYIRYENRARRGTIYK